MSETHFGYRSVDETTKADAVRGVFDSVAPKYDVMNDLMSMGLHRVWKAYTVAVALAGLQHFLARAVALHFGRRRIDAHQLERDAKALAVVEPDLEDARGLMDGDRRGTARDGTGGHGRRSLAIGPRPRHRWGEAVWRPAHAKDLTRRWPRPAS